MKTTFLKFFETLRSSVAVSTRVYEHGFNPTQYAFAKGYHGRVVGSNFAYFLHDPATNYVIILAITGRGEEPTMVTLRVTEIFEWEVFKESEDKII